ncbi:hypothetical protein [uncultured Desulfobulbus sp.]|uniref:hypothetical protein n=1 Tax=uncultured Desulfobulbus sp. TaxID=239745 RepID=UPI0029C9ACE2|nr:hypothetical protein [uncultured Desulfobulbus sp.]
MPEEERREKKEGFVSNSLIFNDVLIEIVFGEEVVPRHETVVRYHGNHSFVAQGGRRCGGCGTLVLRSVTDRLSGAPAGNWQVG